MDYFRSLSDSMRVSYIAARNLFWRPVAVQLCERVRATATSLRVSHTYLGPCTPRQSSKLPFEVRFGHLFVGGAPVINLGYFDKTILSVAGKLLTSSDDGKTPYTLSALRSAKHLADKKAAVKHLVITHILMLLFFLSLLLLAATITFIVLRKVVRRYIRHKAAYPLAIEADSGNIDEKLSILSRSPVAIASGRDISVLIKNRRVSSSEDSED